jgi:uncharacterized protein YyaL (SSP411 family)
MWDADRSILSRRYRDGDVAIDGYAEDYAFLVFGLLELFQAGGDPRWLEWASQLQDVLDERFRDPADGGWFATTGEDPTVLLRLKEDTDGAEPSAGSISVLNLLTLVHLRPDDERLERARRALARFGPRIGSAARAIPMMLAALSTWHAGLSQVVIVGERERLTGQPLLRDMQSRHERALETEALAAALVEALRAGR